jgi:MoxR-like ATPase
MSDILLDKTIKNGDVIWEEKRALLLMADPEATIVFDEVFGGPADVNIGLNSLTDDDMYIDLPNGQRYFRHKGCNIILTTNPQGYAGVKRQHQGFLDRFPKLQMDYHPEEEKIIKTEYPDADEETVAKYKTLFNLCRDSKKQGGGLETEFSTRGLKTLVGLTMDGMEFSDALRAAVKLTPDDEKAVADFVRTAMNGKYVPISGGKLVLEQLAELEDMKNKEKKHKSEIDAAKNEAKIWEAKAKKTEEQLNNVRTYVQDKLKAIGK